jgi:hypothetical protein
VLAIDRSQSQPYVSFDSTFAEYSRATIRMPHDKQVREAYKAVNGQDIRQGFSCRAASIADDNAGDLRMLGKREELSEERDSQPPV